MQVFDEFKGRCRRCGLGVWEARDGSRYFMAAGRPYVHNHKPRKPLMLLALFIAIFIIAVIIVTAK